MTDETNKNENTTPVTSQEISKICEKLEALTLEVEKLHQSQKTVMVGWNAFLKSAEAQLKVLFRGTIPAPLLRKLIQTAFKGLEEAERKGK